MSPRILTLLLAFVLATNVRALDATLFPIQMSYDTGIDHTFVFRKDGSYTLETAPNEARGYAGGRDEGTYSFESTKHAVTISLDDGRKIRFLLTKAPDAGDTLEVTGMVYGKSGQPRFPDEKMPILIKKLK